MTKLPEGCAVKGSFACALYATASERADKAIWEAERQKSRADAAEKRCAELEGALRGAEDYTRAQVDAADCRSDEDCDHCLGVQYLDDWKRVLSRTPAAALKRAQLRDAVVETAKVWQSFPPLDVTPRSAIDELDQAVRALEAHDKTP
jgi:hypothetical protein